VAGTAEAGVCNRALLRIGQSQLINDLGQATPIARACKALFADSRDACLEARDWPFARKRATLTALTDGARGGWAYGYSFPEDCIAPRYIEAATDSEDNDDELTSSADATGLLTGARPIPFDLEDGTNGPIILTDQPSAELVYTARITAVPRFTPLFKNCLAYLLASDLAFGIAKKPEVGEAMAKLFERAIERAAASASKHRKPRARPLSAFERVR
jgi:hypothetical protein